MKRYRSVTNIIRRAERSVQLHGWTNAHTGDVRRIPHADNNTPSKRQCEVDHQIRMFHTDFPLSCHDQKDSNTLRKYILSHETNSLRQNKESTSSYALTIRATGRYCASLAVDNITDVTRLLLCSPQQSASCVQPLVRQSSNNAICPSSVDRFTRGLFRDNDPTHSSQSVQPGHK